MYAGWGINLRVVLSTLARVLTCVLLHYEGLNLLAQRLSHREGARRPRALYAVLGVIGLHIVEIWVFGGGLWALLHLPQAGRILGGEAGGLLDAVYLSAVTFTTVGFGDVVPSGSVRFLLGTEALTGFVLITWSAAFTFIEMERHWRMR